MAEKRREKTSAAGGGNTRSEMLRIKKERERKEQRQRQQMLVIGLVVAAVVIVGIFALINVPADAPIPEGVQTRYEGVTSSLSAEGYPQLGNPAASVIVKEYASFDCPHCGDFHENVFPLLLDRIRSGQILFVYVPLYGTGGIVNGEGAARAAICAAQQGKFWEYHDMLFSWQGIYANQAYTQARLTSGAGALGLDAGAVGGCITSSTATNVLNIANQEARNLPGFSGTPTVTVNGTIVTAEINAINQAIDQALAFAAPVVPTAATAATAEPTSEATTAPAATTEPTAEGTPGS